MSATQLSWRALTTMAFIGALVIQAGISFIVEPEPYPAVRMPSFGSAPNKSNMFPTDVASVKITYSDGTTLEPHVSELLSSFRFSSARYSFDYVFKPGSPGTPDQEVITWLAGQARELAGGKNPKQIEMCWYKTELDIRSATYKNIGECDAVVIKL